MNATPSHLRLLAAFLVCLSLISCGGGSDSPPAGRTGPKSGPQLTAADKARMLAYFKTLLRGEAAAAASGSGIERVPVTTPMPVSGAPAAGAPGGAADAPMAGSFSGTTLQEAGVDEDDLVKTNGRAIYSVDPERKRVRLARIQPTNPQLLERGHIDAVTDDALAIGGIYLHSARSRLAVVAGPRSALDVHAQWFQPDAFGGRHVEVSVWDVSAVDDAMSNANQLYRMRIDGQLVGSRRIGDQLYLVLRYRPFLAAPEPYWSSEMVARSDGGIDALTAEQVLPSVTIDGAAARPLMTPAACWMHEGNLDASADVMSIVAIDLAAGSPSLHVSCFVGGSEAFYVSPRNLYLATTQSRYQRSSSSPVYPTGTRTDVHKFALEASIEYRGSAEVEGHLGWEQNRKSFRLGEFGEHLGVISFTGSDWAVPMPIVAPPPGASSDALPAQASPATLTILREDAHRTLATVATLPNTQRPAPLGKPGEQLYATRFLGSRAFLVTYRLTDPLYLLDLSDPRDPRIAGELEVSGYSDYLFPLSENLLLGVGKEAVETGDEAGDGRFAWYQGVKVSLIDMTDAARPLEVAKHLIGRRGSHSTVQQTHHGLAMLGRVSSVRVALAVNVHSTPPGFPGAELPPNVNADYTYTGLHRYEIDLAAKTLIERPPIVAPLTSPGYYGPDIGGDRAVLVDEQVHYLRAGQWLSGWW